MKSENTIMYAYKIGNEVFVYLNGKLIYKKGLNNPVDMSIPGSRSHDFCFKPINKLL